MKAKYDNRRDPLAQVLRSIDRNGARDGDSLSLDVEDDLGNVTTIAYGKDLAALAFDEGASSPLGG